MIFDALVVGHVRTNLQRAALSIVAIALGVATALALWLASSITLTTLDSDRTLFAGHVDFRILPFGARLPANVYADVRYVEGVASASPIIDQPIVIGVDPRTGSGGTSARLIGVDLLQPLPGVTGFAEGLPGPFAPVGAFIDPAAVIGANGAVVSPQTAARLHLRRGSRFTVLAGAGRRDTAGRERAAFSCPRRRLERGFRRRHDGPSDLPLWRNGRSNRHSHKRGAPERASAVGRRIGRPRARGHWARRWVIARGS